MTNRKGGTERGKHAAERRKDEKKIALILTAMLTVSLAGCGGGNDKSSESKKDDTGRKRYQM